MVDWKEYKLSDIATFSQGIQVGIEKQSAHCLEGYIRFLRIVDYTKNNEPPRYIKHPGDKYIAEPDDIIMMRYGTPGRVVRGYYGAIANNMFKITIDPTIVSKQFAYYYLFQESVYQTLIGSQSSSTMPAINFDIVGRLPIFIPNIKIQEQIVSVLSSLDSKIRCLRHINVKLEEQAQTLFKSWFVNFDTFSEKEYIEVDWGAIPKNLNTKYISEIPHTLETGRRPKGGVGEINSGVPSVGAEHVKGLGNYDYSKTKYITEEYASSLKTGKVNGYELLIYKDGGKPGYFIPNYSIFGEGYPFDEFYLNEHVFKLDFGNKGYNAFCYFFFQTDYVMNYLNAQGGKAAIPGINRQDIENILIFTPDNEMVMKFSEFVLPLIKQILFNCKESRRLTELRNTLLPRLMSGELRVKDIENSL